jgi:hypothetical protein
MIIQVRYDTMYYYEVVSTAVRTEEQVPCITSYMWNIYKIFLSFCKWNLQINTKRNFRIIVSNANILIYKTLLCLVNTAALSCRYVFEGHNKYLYISGKIWLLAGGCYMWMPLKTRAWPPASNNIIRQYITRVSNV